MNKQEIKEAIAWFRSRGIEAREVNDTVYITVLDFEVEVSTGEVLYRSDLFKEENNEQ